MPVLHPKSVVWLPYERIYGELISLGAFASTVAYVKGGIEYEVIVENDEFEIVGDLIEYDAD
jgi:hypothetical protein